jgi:hypothetical protein
MQLRELLGAAAEYLKRHPEELILATVNATQLRFGVPIEALRWAASQVSSPKAPKDIELETVPPGLRLSASLDAMGTPLRASAVVSIEEVSMAAGSLRVLIRLTEVSLTLLGESSSPLATLVKSGALDLSKPGNLIKVLPKRPDAILEAEGERIHVDLMKVPALANDDRLQQLLTTLSAILGIRALETDRDHLYVGLRVKPYGVPRAIRSVKEYYDRSKTGPDMLGG